MLAELLVDCFEKKEKEIRGDWKTMPIVKLSTILEVHRQFHERKNPLFEKDMVAATSIAITNTFPRQRHDHGRVRMIKQGGGDKETAKTKVSVTFNLEFTNGVRVPYYGFRQVHKVDDLKNFIPYKNKPFLNSSHLHYNIPFSALQTLEPNLNCTNNHCSP